MCGIVGYTGPRDASEVLLSSLRHLEYRGYDSAGIAVIGEHLEVYKDKGELAVIEHALPSMHGGIGIGHTRWATCGKPSQENAHPFTDCSGTIALVHNGIIENYAALKKGLLERGHAFSSETDTEVIVHLVEERNSGDLRKALVSALSDIKGTYAVVLAMEGSERIVAARKENPLVIGVGVGENFVASDVTALLDYTSKVLYLMDGEIAEISPSKVTIFDSSGQVVRRKPEMVTWTAEDAKRGGFAHFMLKEIFEQPEAIRNTLIGNIDRLDQDDGVLGGDISSVKLVACGTSYHAGLVGKYVLEKLGKLPTTVELASEFRYSSDVREDPLVIVISQSGETADALAATREARRRGLRTLAVTNVVGSTITREAEETMYTRAGPEIGVAATKTYISQLVALYLTAMRIGHRRRTVDSDTLRSLRTELTSIPQIVRRVLDNSDSVMDACALIAKSRDAFYLGRNISYPVMLEGALKLKEISYIHAEGYAAGELKHGPLALIGPETPVIAACIRDHTYDKMIANLSEVKAREAPVIAIANEGDEEIEQVADKVVRIPEVQPLFSPFPLSVATQLIAYHVADLKGCSIDKPRNLAKSVTVE